MKEACPTDAPLFFCQLLTLDYFAIDAAACYVAQAWGRSLMSGFS